MGTPFLLPPQSLIFKTFLFLSTLFPTYFAVEDDQFSACKPFSCGNITNISYPFRVNSQPDYCGHPKFNLDCHGDNVTINITSHNFRVINVNLTTRILRIARSDLWGSKCPNEYTNISLDYAFFNYTLDNENTTLLYDCDPVTLPAPLNISTSVRFDCPINGVPRDSYFMLSTEWVNVSVLGCKIGIIVPILEVAVKSFIRDALDSSYVIEQGFEVAWEVDEGKCENCRSLGGRCGHNVSTDEFKCLCPNQIYDETCGINPLGTPIPAPLQSVYSSSFHLLM